MELMAPGENILMNWNYQNVATGDGYGSGTSFAAPLAAGAALWFMTHSRVLSEQLTEHYA